MKKVFIDELIIDMKGGESKVKLKWILFILAAIIFGIAVGFFWTRKADAKTQVTICHSNGESGTFTQQTVDWDSVVAGWGHNRSGHQDGKDIIPSGFWDIDGRNWNDEGKAIYDNGCVVPEPKFHNVCREFACIKVEGEGECTCESDKDCEPEITPTPIPDVTPTPEPKDDGFPQPCNGCEEAKAPTCTGDPDVTVAPINFFITRNGDKAEAKWVPTGGSMVNLYYKENGQAGWTHAVADEVNDGQITVGGLNSALGYTFGLQQRYHCGDGMTVTAVVIDPPAWGKIFTTSYFLTW